MINTTGIIRKPERSKNLEKNARFCQKQNFIPVTMNLIESNKIYNLSAIYNL